jgi:predicted dehydrogenase
MAPVGLCIAGCGRFAAFHARAARALSGRVAVSFASRNPATAAAYRRRFGGVAAFGSYEEAAADPRVQALLFCTPHHVHLDNVRLAARSGKAVLVEKPMARTLEEADRMLAEARAAGIPFMVGENFHFMPAFAAARRLLAAGAIGEVRQILATPRGFRVPEGWRRVRESVGGGVLIDSGVHYVHLLRDWGGPIAEVTARAPSNVFTELEAEDTAFLLVRFRSGAVGVLVTSIATPGAPRGPGLVASGTNGSLVVDTRGRYLWVIGASRRRLQVFLRDRRGLRAQVAEFVRAVSEQRAPALPAESAREDLAIVRAAYRSIETGEAVALARTGREEAG